MKRTFRHLLVAIATFLTGATSHQLFNGRAEEPARPHAEWVRVAVPDPGDAPREPPRVERKFVFDYDPLTFNPRGDYFVLGPKPKELRHFDGIELVVEADGSEIQGHALIMTSAGDGYDAPFKMSGVVTQRWIYLVAEPVSEDGVGYRFEGEFLRQGVLSQARKSEAVLRGRLTKIQGGAKIAEAVFSFRVEYLGC